MNAKQLRLVLISDTHEELIDPQDMPEGDVLVHAGDFTYVGSQQKVLEFNGWCRDVKHKYKNGIVVIAGNHDKTFDALNHMGKPEVVVPMLTNCIYLNDSGVEIEGFKFWGSPQSPAFGRNWAFQLDRAEADKTWDLIPDDTDVLVTHGPPLNILDGVPHQRWDTKGNCVMNFLEHVGCYDLRRAVARVKPKVHVFGHIHEGYGTHQEDGTWFINASIMDETYWPRNKPICITITK